MKRLPVKPAAIFVFVAAVSCAPVRQVDPPMPSATVSSRVPTASVVPPTTLPLVTASTVTATEAMVPEWNLYADPAGRFQFEYPGVYDTQRFVDLGCGPHIDGQSVYITPRILVSWADAGGEDLQSVVGHFQANIVEPGEVEISSIAEVEFSGQPAQSVEYRFGGAQRLGMARIAVIDNTVYQAEYTDGFECYVDDEAIYYLLDVYSRMVDTFVVKGQP